MDEIKKQLVILSELLEKNKCKCSDSKCAEKECAEKESKKSEEEQKEVEKVHEDHNDDECDECDEDCEDCFKIDNDIDFVYKSCPYAEGGPGKCPHLKSLYNEEKMDCMSFLDSPWTIFLVFFIIYFIILLVIKLFK